MSLTEFREKSANFYLEHRVQKNHNVGISLSFKLLKPTTDVHTALVIRQTKRQLAITVAGRVLKER